MVKFQGKSLKIKKQPGFTLIEVTFAILILSIAGFGVFGIYQIALKTLAGDKARQGAISILSEKMELIRNLPYDKVGTIDGTVAGNILQNETIIRNNAVYNVNTQIIYIDDVFDGTEGGIPNDPIATDYKKVTITISWTTNFGPKSFTASSYVAPKGMESNTGGGTLRIKTLNAKGLPMPMANVHLKNNRISTPIDTVLQTSESGILNIPGLEPALESYSIYVTKNGCNADYTCAIDVNGMACTDAEGNPKPIKPHASVIEGNLTEISFNIDLFSTLDIHTLKQATPIYKTINSNDSGYDQDSPTIAQCPNGSYLFSWRDFSQSNNPRIRGQKYNSALTAIWPKDLQITSSDNQGLPEIAVDSSCNVYIIWQDSRDGNLDLYFNKYNSDGIEIWGGEKKLDVQDNFADQSQPQIEINASSTEIYIVWSDNRDGAKGLYGQKINTAGIFQWLPEIKISADTASVAQNNPDLKINKYNQAFIAWNDSRNGNNDIFLQKISSSGNRFWAADITPTTERLFDQLKPSLAIDHDNEYIYLVWQDNRNGYFHIYLQKLNFDGDQIWTSGDIKIDSASDNSDAQNPKVVIDNDGDIYVAWNDNRNGADDIYLQKIDNNGNILLADDFRLNANISGQQENPKILINTSGYLVITWQDDSSGNFDIIAAKFTETLAKPTPVPNVNLTVTGSKIIGSDPMIYKYQNNFSTDANGRLNIPDVEWDGYNIEILGNYSLKKTEPPMPIEILPDTSQIINIFVNPL